MAAKLLGEGQVDDITGHLVRVGHAGIVFTSRRPFAAAHTDDAFSDTVVEQRGIDLPGIVFIEESCVDEIGRLSLHGAVLVARTGGEVDARVDERSVEGEREVGQTDKGEVFADIEFHTEVVGTLCILVGVDKTRSSGHGIGPFDGVLKTLVESCQRNLLSLRGIELISQVYVVDIARL